MHEFRHQLNWAQLPHSGFAIKRKEFIHLDKSNYYYILLKCPKTNITIFSSCHDFVSKNLLQKTTIIIEWIFIKYFYLVKYSQPPEACKCQLISDSPNPCNRILYTNLSSPGTPLLLFARVLHISWEWIWWRLCFRLFLSFHQASRKSFVSVTIHRVRVVDKKGKKAQHTTQARVNKSLSSSLLTFSMLSFLYPKMTSLSKNKKYRTNTRMLCMTKT